MKRLLLLSLSVVLVSFSSVPLRKFPGSTRTVGSIKVKMRLHFPVIITLKEMTLLTYPFRPKKLQFKNDPRFWTDLLKNRFNTRSSLINTIQFDDHKRSLHGDSDHSFLFVSLFFVLISLIVLSSP